jgi:hypothetical protein
VLVAPDSGEESAQATRLVSDLVSSWLGEVQRLYDWSQQPDNSWAAEDVVDQFSKSAVNMFPLFARGIDFGLELLRPWSQAFAERTSTGDSDG